MTTTAPAIVPPALYFQAADDTIRYSHNGHPVPDGATMRAALDARGVLRPDGSARIVDYQAVKRELTAAADAAPVLPGCGPCGGVGMPPGGDPAAGREAPPVEQRCQDCHGSGRAPAVLTVGRVTLTPSEPPSSEDLEDWHGMHPSDGAGLFVRCYAPTSLAPGRDRTRPWEIILWPGWEDGSRIPVAALNGPGYPTRAAAVTALGAACRARYGAAWAHEPHHCRETFHPADGGAWQAECTRCPWRSPLSTPDDPGSHRRAANDHTMEELAAAHAGEQATAVGAVLCAPGGAGLFAPTTRGLGA